MKVCTVLGARPQFVKASVVNRALRAAGAEEVLLHTGQHYDEAMDGVFFDELGLPRPAVNLGVGSGSHAAQTAEMMRRLEPVLEAARPDVVLVYGDTNSTLAGALVAAKLVLPLAHVEAGLRSFDRRMPEEVNRIVTDRLSTLLFCPTPTAVGQLRHEGITDGVFLTGDVMLDATRHFADLAAERRPLRQWPGLAPGGYYLATIHRAGNTDDPGRLAALFSALGRLDAPVVLPLHPRTRARMQGIDVPPTVRLLPPQGYLAMLTLLGNARRVLTDSGGVQKEALWLGVPCVTLRDETEWVETLAGGWNRLAGADPERIVAAVYMEPEGPPPETGEGGAAVRIAELLVSSFP